MSLLAHSDYNTIGIGEGRFSVLGVSSSEPRPNPAMRPFSLLLNLA